MKNFIEIGTQDNQLQIVSCDKTVSEPVPGDKIIVVASSYGVII